jgi:hypothetical protein
MHYIVCYSTVASEHAYSVADPCSIPQNFFPFLITMFMMASWTVTFHSLSSL